MNITKLILVETGTYNDMALRPFHTQFNQQSQLQLTEATRGGRNLSSSNLAGIAGQIIQPSAMALGTVSIDNGWNTRRFRFFMRVEHENRFGDTIVQFLTGYTDHCDTTLQSRFVDPNMRLYFNNSITMREVVEMTNFGRVKRLTMADASQILVGPYQPDFRALPTAAHTMRPQDVFDTIAAQTLDQSRMPVYDTRTSFSEGAKKSRRSNASAPTYLSRLLTGYRMAANKSDESVTLDNMMDEAAGSVREGLISNDTTLSELQRNTSFATGSSVTMRELYMLCPNLERTGPGAIVDVLGNRGVQMTGFQTHERGQSEHWVGTSTETVMATVLSHSIPSIMMDLMLSEIAITSTNRTLTGGFETIWQARPHSLLESPGVEAPDLTQQMEAFIFRLENEILRDLTQNNQIDLNVAIHVDILNDTSLHISLGGKPPIHYVTPSFCDNLMTPMLTNSGDNLRDLALDIASMADVIGMSANEEVASAFHNNHHQQLVSVPKGPSSDFTTHPNLPRSEF